MAKQNAKESKPAAAKAEAPVQVKETAKPAVPVVAAGGGGHLRLVNTSRNIFIFPLTQYTRQQILPGKSWDVPNEHVDLVKKCLKSSYYEALIGKGMLKAINIEPSRVGETDLKAPETPDSPRELSETSEHVTHAGFVKKA